MKIFFEAKSIMVTEENIWDNLDDPFIPESKVLTQAAKVFNKMFFNNKLRKVEFHGKKMSLKQVGEFRYEVDVVKKHIKTNVLPDNSAAPIININTSYEFNKRQVWETLLHELIHMLQYQNNPKELADNPHGSFFKAKMNEINIKSDDIVTITEVNDEKLSVRPTKKKQSTKEFATGGNSARNDIAGERERKTLKFDLRSISNNGNFDPYDNSGKELSQEDDIDDEIPPSGSELNNDKKNDDNKDDLNQQNPNNTEKLNPETSSSQKNIKYRDSLKNGVYGVAELETGVKAIFFTKKEDMKIIAQSLFKNMNFVANGYFFEAVDYFSADKNLELTPVLGKTESEYNRNLNSLGKSLSSVRVKNYYFYEVSKIFPKYGIKSSFDIGDYVTTFEERDFER